MTKTLVTVELDVEADRSLQFEDLREALPDYLANRILPVLTETGFRFTDSGAFIKGIKVLRISLPGDAIHRDKETIIVNDDVRIEGLLEESTYGAKGHDKKFVITFSSPGAEVHSGNKLDMRIRRQQEDSAVEELKKAVRSDRPCKLLLEIG